MAASGWNDGGRFSDGNGGNRVEWRQPDVLHPGVKWRQSDVIPSRVECVGSHTPRILDLLKDSKELSSISDCFGD